MNPTDKANEIEMADETTQGWRLKVVRDESDPRFAVLTVRHELGPVEGLPTGELEGEKAQYAFLHTCIGFCTQAGVLPPHVAMRWFQILADKIGDVEMTPATSEEPSRLILPPGMRS